jgi:ubiquinone/menaquinone biosynthesis C-methylase UbiE
LTPASLSFDQAADFYDDTRDLPGPIATDGIRTIFEQLRGRAGPGAQVLEVGAGTGRIGLPLMARGANLVGVDLSARMLARQRRKEPTARVAQADATQLPFAAAQFDGLLTIHVLHLIGDWRAALREFRRVLRPNGVYINSRRWHNPDDVERRISDFWHSRVEAHGANWRRPGIQPNEDAAEELGQMGAAVEQITPVRFFASVTPQSVVDGVASRVDSDSWGVPDEVFDQTLAELRAWAVAEFVDLDQPVSVERRFMLDVARFT